jgi:hypothetical protein
MSLNTKDFLRRNWGILALAIVSLYALARLLHQPVPGHYRIFTGAAHALWRGENPYGTDFGTGVGLWFYSPSCALFFFGPFDLLPEKLGLALYMLISWGAFVWGARAFARALRCESVLQLFFALIAPQMLSAIVSSKLEILILGAVFLAGAAVVSGRWVAVSAVLLAWTIDWKFQPLPTAGLLALVFILVRRDWRWPAWLAGALAVFHFLPRLFVPMGLWQASTATRAETLRSFIGSSWLHFENIYAFSQHFLGMSYGYGAAQLAAACAGGILAIALVGAIRGLGRADAARCGAILALSLGAAFTCAFSPLNQNNGYILYAPLLLGALVIRGESHETARRAWALAIGIAWAVMALAYSDAVPPAAREALRHAALKSVICLALALALAARALRQRELQPA